MIRLVFQAARATLEEVEGKYSEARAILDEVYIYIYIYMTPYGYLNHDYSSSICLNFVWL